jgi:hypothetical protein
VMRWVGRMPEYRKVRMPTGHQLLDRICIPKTSPSWPECHGQGEAAYSSGRQGRQVALRAEDLRLTLRAQGSVGPRSSNGLPHCSHSEGHAAGINSSEVALSAAVVMVMVCPPPVTEPGINA